MADYLALAPYRTVSEDLEPGGTMRVNHNDCTAGEDTRRRLYLTRPLSDPTRIIGYCHNCQLGGALSTGVHKNYRDHKHVSPQIGPTVLAMKDLIKPNHMLPDYKDWPIHATAWAMKGKLSGSLCKDYGIQYDPSSNRVYLPRYLHTSMTPPHTGDLMGYQLRNTDPYVSGPKYLTVVTDKDRGYTLLQGKVLRHNSRLAVVVVEDLVSGINVVEAFDGAPWTVDVLINYGTKVNLEALYTCATYAQVLVWLDNDSDHVRSQAETMTRTIALITRTISNVQADVYHSDPKGYTYEDIRKIVLKGIACM